MIMIIMYVGCYNVHVQEYMLSYSGYETMLNLLNLSRKLHVKCVQGTRI